jgi:hypothetical protein
MPYFMFACETSSRGNLAYSEKVGKKLSGVSIHTFHFMMGLLKPTSND